jgi:hypothetical protein
MENILGQKQIRIKEGILQRHESLMFAHALIFAGIALEEGIQSDEAKPKKSNTKVIVAIIVIAIVIVAILALAPARSPGVKIVSWSVERNVPFLGDIGGGNGLFTVKVTNSGDATESKTIWCEFTIGQNTYREDRSITLAPEQTQTYAITVLIPGFDWYNSGSGRCYLA